MTLGVKLVKEYGDLALSTASIAAKAAHASRLYKTGKYELALAAAEEAHQAMQGYVARSTEKAKGEIQDEDERAHLEALAQLVGEVAPTMLAELDLKMGRYSEALPLLKLGLEVAMFAEGRGESWYVPSALGQLAEANLNLGDVAEAEERYTQAFDAARKLLPGDARFAETASWDTRTTQVAINLLNVHMLREHYDQAEPLIRRAEWALRGKTDSEESARLHLAKSRLAWHQGLLDLAFVEAEAASEVLLELFGESHPLYAAALTQCARILADQAQYSKAEALHRRIAQILEDCVGHRHELVASNMFDLGKTLAQQQRFADAIDAVESADSIMDSVIGEVISVTSEAQQLIYLEQVRARINIALSIAVSLPPGDADVPRRVYDLVLKRKGLAAEILTSQRRAVLIDEASDSYADFLRLRRLREAAAAKTLAGPGPEGRREHDALLNKWESERKELELQLASRLPDLQIAALREGATVDTVTGILPEGSALLEFLLFERADFSPRGSLSEASASIGAHYGAFIVLGRDSPDIHLVDLGPAEQIDKAVTRLRAAISWGSRGLCDAAADDLGERILLPLVDNLEGSKRLLIAADGNLGQVPFDVLRLHGKYAVDEFRISYLSCGRDLLTLATQSQGTPGPSVVVADPDFDLGAPHERVRALGANASRTREIDESGLVFRRLGATALEGREVASLLGVKPILNTRALERALKAATAPYVLHIATHGFFLKRQGHDIQSVVMPRETMGARDLLVGRVENPMLRCGLALAGANTWISGGSLPSEAEDGILTGEDVGVLDLVGTELVVLSACQTGLGDFEAGEGVFGLRRAFVVSGARTLVMSLWKVPDKPTQQLMRRMYEKLLAGATREDALREAQIAVRRRHPNPRDWGGFILQGATGGLPLLDP